MRKCDAVLLALGGLWLPAAHSQQSEPAPDAVPPDAARPDIEFLEYLGSWQADDDEWWVIAEWDKDNEADGVKDADAPDEDGRGPGGDGGKDEDRDEPDPPQPRK